MVWYGTVGKALYLMSYSPDLSKLLLGGNLLSIVGRIGLKKPANVRSLGSYEILSIGLIISIRIFRALCFRHVTGRSMTIPPEREWPGELSTVLS